ncbi:MAG: rhomboid family intramembrane serine protease [Pyrinomonadaceae bacterium]
MSPSYKSDIPEDEPEFFDEASLWSTPYYTYILVGAILAVTAIQITTGLERSIILAGFDKQAFLHGEYWRILTGATLHGNLPHVAMNCFAFYNFGKIFEMLSNRAHLAIVFLISALGGGLLSVIFEPDGLSVGASGGIVGLVGYLAVYAFRRRQFVTAEFRKSLLTNIAIILIFGLLLFQVVDNYGHIGGLVTGAVYGLLQITADAYVDPRLARRPVQLLGIAAVAIYIGGCLFTSMIMLGRA